MFCFEHGTTLEWNRLFVGKSVLMIHSVVFHHNILLAERAWLVRCLVTARRAAAAFNAGGCHLSLQDVPLFMSLSRAALTAHNLRLSSMDLL